MYTKVTDVLAGASAELLLGFCSLKAEFRRVCVSMEKALVGLGPVFLEFLG